MRTNNRASSILRAQLEPATLARRWKEPLPMNVLESSSPPPPPGLRRAGRPSPPQACGGEGEEARGGSAAQLTSFFAGWTLSLSLSPLRGERELPASRWFIPTLLSLSPLRGERELASLHISHLQTPREGTRPTGAAGRVCRPRALTRRTVLGLPSECELCGQVAWWQQRCASILHLSATR
jgi:hypothetical protein